MYIVATGPRSRGTNHNVWPSGLLVELADPLMVRALDMRFKTVPVL